MIAIGLTGLARSGKDTVAGYISKKYGFKVFTFSDIIAEELRKKSMDITKENMSIFGKKMREDRGYDILGRLILEKASGNEKVVFNGFRCPEELLFIKRNVEKFYLIRIDSPEGTRFKRKTKIDLQTNEEFFRRDEREIADRGFGEVLKAADFVIENDSTKDELYKKIDALMGKIQ